MVLLLRAESHARWDARELARRLYIPQLRAAELLRQLGEAGLVVGAGDGSGWHWRPEPAAAALVEQVAQCYAANLLDITKLIHSGRDRSARQFADAFRWRKEH